PMRRNERERADRVRERLAAEVGLRPGDAPRRVALVYPSPYAVGMSSLGFQQIYRLLNERDDVAAERAFLPDDDDATRDVPGGACLTTYESGRAVGDFPVIGLSVAYELELAGV